MGWCTVTRTATLYRHIELDEKQRPVIAGTGFKVRVLVELWQGGNWSPAELHEQFPVLSMAQIHSAIAYYWDHKAEIDKSIAELEEMEQAYRQMHPEPPALERLRELKRGEIEGI